MGLDVGFYRDGEEVFDLRNHHDLFEFFADASAGNVDEIYDDFYVTLDTLDIVGTMLEKEFAACGLAPSKALTEIPEQFHHLDARDEKWAQLLRYYPAIIAFLRSEIVESGPLVCSWSA